MMVSLMVMKISHGRSQSVTNKKNHPPPKNTHPGIQPPPPELKMLIKVYPFLRHASSRGNFPNKTSRYKNSPWRFCFVIQPRAMNEKKQHFFPTTYVNPKNLKVSHWRSQCWLTKRSLVLRRKFDQRILPKKDTDLNNLLTI